MKCAPKLAVVAMLGMMALWPVGGPSHAQAAIVQPPETALAIIVHRSNPIENISRRDLRRIFMLERQTWPSGRRITVVLRNKGQPERAAAIRLICGLSEAQYDRHVLLETFRGTVDRGPREILSADALVRFVFNVPGAIGHVPASEVDDSVKVLQIDGLLPGAPGYPLVLARRPDPEVP